MITLSMWQVQGSIQGQTPDGWSSSRELPTMIIGARDGVSAARQVSDLAWMVTPRSYVTQTSRTGILTVLAVDPDGEVGLRLTWVFVTYGWGAITATGFDTYAELDAFRLTQAGR